MLLQMPFLLVELAFVTVPDESTMQRRALARQQGWKACSTVEHQLDTGDLF